MDLNRLLNPARVGVIGASEHGPGGSVVKALLGSGYPGEIVAVNPKYSDVLGVPCVESIEAAGPVDCVFIMIARHRTPGVLRECGRAGVGAAVVFAGGFGESSNDGRQLEAELAAAAHQSGIALLGPNSMGVVNAAVPMGLWVGAEHIPAGLSGSVLVGQSGGMIDAVRTLGKPTGPQLFVDTGNEAILTTADFVDFLADDPAVSAIGLIVEAVKDVDGMAAALSKAQDLRKPVVGLQVGRSERGSAAIFGHTGALVSDADALRAFLARHGVLEVRDIDELTETLSLLVSGIETKGRGVVLVGTSGGKTAHFADLCEESGLELAEIGPQTCRKLAGIFDTDYTGANPIDMGLGPEGVEARQDQATCWRPWSPTRPWASSGCAATCPWTRTASSERRTMWTGRCGQPRRRRTRGRPWCSSTPAQPAAQARAAHGASPCWRGRPRASTPSATWWTSRRPAERRL